MSACLPVYCLLSAAVFFLLSAASGGVYHTLAPTQIFSVEEQSADATSNLLYVRTPPAGSEATPVSQCFGGTDTILTVL
jgi:hypothetical protein